MHVSLVLFARVKMVRRSSRSAKQLAIDIVCRNSSSSSSIEEEHKGSHPTPSLGAPALAHSTQPQYPSKSVLSGVKLGYEFCTDAEEAAAEIRVHDASGGRCVLLANGVPNQWMICASLFFGLIL